jgi:hypothetical protein
MSRQEPKAGALDIVLLCNRPAHSADASTVTDHLDAFARYSRHRVQQLSFLGDLPSAVDLGQFDVLVIHYSIAIGYLSEHYMSPAARQRVAAFPGLKVLFMQDEYRAINAVHKAVRRMGIHLLFTCMPEAEIAKVYPPGALPGVVAVNNLTGYVPERLVRREVAPIASRPIDVGYRTRKPPYWLGELGFEKWDIADRFAAHAEGSGLRLDLSYAEADRLYGEDWTRFIAQSKSMLGVESGASAFDFDGTLQERVDAYVAAHPRATFREVQQKFLVPHEGRIRQNQISPRCFEAAALRTAMVLYEGEYSGVLQPGRHFLPLRKDFANFPEVLDALRDAARLQRMADCAYEEIACNPAYGYASFIGGFDERVERELERRTLVRSGKRYSGLRFGAQLARSPRYVVHRSVSRFLQWLLLGTRLRPLVLRAWALMPFGARRIIRPLLRLIGR